MKKKYIGLLLVVALGLAMVGCGDKEEKIESTQVEEKEEGIVEEKEDLNPEDMNQDQGEDMDRPVLAIGAPLPDFISEDRDGNLVELLDIDGNKISIEDYRGKIVLVNFWATWCVYCDAEMPDFEKLLENYEDVVVLAVNVMEEEGEVKDYIESHGYGFPVIMDEEGHLAANFMVQGFPATYFVDEEGIFKGAFPSMMTYDQMEEIVNDIRDKKL